MDKEYYIVYDRKDKCLILGEHNHTRVLFDKVYLAMREINHYEDTSRFEIRKVKLCEIKD